MSEAKYQMLSADHPAVQAVVKGRPQPVEMNQDNPNMVELKTPPSSAPANELEKGEDKTVEMKINLFFTPTQWAVLTRQAIQRNLDVKDVCQLLIDEKLEGAVGKTFITGPGGNKLKVKGPSIHRGGEF